MEKKNEREKERQKEEDNVMEQKRQEEKKTKRLGGLWPAIRIPIKSIVCYTEADVAL